MKVGDLVSWPQGYCGMPGVVLDREDAKKLPHGSLAFGEGCAVLVMLPELGNDPEWFHERELEVLNNEN